MNEFKTELLIRIYGDSLSLPRAQDNVVPSKVYSEALLAQMRSHYPEREVTLYNRSIGGATVTELLASYRRDNGYFGESPTIIIIQSGVVDCAPRPVPIWLRKVIGKLPSPLKKRIVKWLHDNRARLLDKGILFRMTRADDFKAAVRTWIAEASKQSLAVLVVNIAPTTDEIELHSPKFKESIELFNQILSDCVKEANTETVRLIDIWSPINQQGADQLMLKDGHHLSVEAHEVYLRELAANLIG